VVALMGWFLISNHCVVGATVTAKTQSAMTQMPCHGNQPAPAKQTGDENMPCCKVLKALEAKTLSVAPATSDFVLKEYIGGAMLPMFSEPHGLLIACDSGPPPLAFSFSESVLQRSILAHAPPFLLS
jgi:hypothetical protein